MAKSMNKEQWVEDVEIKSTEASHRSGAAWDQVDVVI